MLRVAADPHAAATICAVLFGALIILLPKPLYSGHFIFDCDPHQAVQPAISHPQSAHPFRNVRSRGSDRSRASRGCPGFIAGSINDLLEVRTALIRRYRLILGEKISGLLHVASTSTFVAMETVKEK